MQTGKIDVTTDNIFPIIKKFLYSDTDIFLRELVSNAVDATQKLKTLARLGDYKKDYSNPVINIKLDTENKTLTISDQGIGMTAEEIEKYINQIAFSGANEFVDKYKDKAEAIIGHFGLGFYSAFMVASKVEIQTLSYQEGAQAVKWECEGNPEFSISEIDKTDVGTDIILHIDEESKEYLEKNKVQDLLSKYCKFLPVSVAFGNKTMWKDGKEEETDELNIINNTEPAWTKKPADLKDEDYNSFYKELYPYSEDPLFNIHLNVDYPFNLTGILYFPKINNNVEVQKNKIQLYCNQVFVTDSVEGIVPEFLTLLHGVLDSPDIPLNVSRSYLQSDSNVKKISNHITKKVADRLFDIFKTTRDDFEKKWDDLKLFITYGMLSEEKFYERAAKFALLKNTDNKYFTLDEYKTLVSENQTDKEGSVVYLYATDKEEQFTYIEKAKAKGYDVLVLDGQLDAHFINHLESKLEKTRFTRVDADVVDKLIPKEDIAEVSLSETEQGELKTVIEAQLPNQNYWITFESLSADENPMLITQAEFLRRMKDMSKLGGPNAMYGGMPDSYNLVVNANHPLIEKLVADKGEKLKDNLSAFESKLKPLNDEKAALEKLKEGKKDEEVSTEEKDKLADIEKQIEVVNNEKKDVLKKYSGENPLVSQLIDLALLSSNLLKGEALNKFVKRSVDLIK